MPTKLEITVLSQKAIAFMIVHRASIVNISTAWDGVIWKRQLKITNQSMAIVWEHIAESSKHRALISNLALSRAPKIVAILLSTSLPNLCPVYRPAGLHVSDIINYICIKRGIYSERVINPDPDIALAESEALNTRFQLGLAMEHAIKQRYHEDNPKRYLTDLVTRKNKIWLSTDIIDLFDNAAEEIKLTWMSSRDKSFECDDYWKYLVQLMAYCHALGFSVGRLRVCHINGNYKFGTPGADPVAPQYQEHFSRKVLNSNWNMILENADDAAAYKAEKQFTESEE